MKKSFRVPDSGIIDKYENRINSWYCMYPIHAFWDEGPVQAQAALHRALEEYCADPNRSDLSLYVHFPYCAKQCFFCQCATVISRDEALYGAFLDHLDREVAWYVEAFERRGLKPTIREVHLGGGSPSLLTLDEFDRLKTILGRLVAWDQVEEWALEVDPRNGMSRDKMHGYADAGVTRVSFGVQDFDPTVQEAINRVNPPEMIAALLDEATHRRFQGINFDILYGLPLQTVEGHLETMRTVLGFHPERTNICVLGHRPDVFPHQRAYRTEDIPDVVTKMEMKVASLNLMLEAGYERIGIDHFAKRQDRLVRARDERTMQRNNNGYGSGRTTDILGLGPSAVSTLGRCYTQNFYTLRDYTECLEKGQPPVIRGRVCTPDDLLRRAVIFDLILYEEADLSSITARWDADYRDYFTAELAAMARLQDDGLVTLRDGQVALTDVGRLMPRHVCTEFDQYQHGAGHVYRHSREVGNGRKSLTRKLHFAASA